MIVRPNRNPGERVSMKTQDRVPLALSGPLEPADKIVLDEVHYCTTIIIIVFKRRE